MNQHSDNATGDPCAYCGRPIDVLHFRLRPGSGPHGDPADLEPVPFCSQDWLFLSQGQLPPRRHEASTDVSPGRRHVARVGLVLAVAISAALMVLLVWWLLSLIPR